MIIDWSTPFEWAIFSASFATIKFEWLSTLKTVEFIYHQKNKWLNFHFWVFDWASSRKNSRINFAISFWFFVLLEIENRNWSLAIFLFLSESQLCLCLSLPMICASYLCSCNSALLGMMTSCVCSLHAKFQSRQFCERCGDRNMHCWAIVFRTIDMEWNSFVQT